MRVRYPGHDHGGEGEGGGERGGGSEGGGGEGGGGDEGGGSGEGGEGGGGGGGEGGGSGEGGEGGSEGRGGGEGSGDGGGAGCGGYGSGGGDGTSGPHTKCSSLNPPVGGAAFRTMWNSHGLFGLLRRTSSEFARSEWTSWQLVKPFGLAFNPSDPCTSIATFWPDTQLSARSLTEYSWWPANPTGSSSRDGDILHGPGDDHAGIHDGRDISPHSDFAPRRIQRLTPRQPAVSFWGQFFSRFLRRVPTVYT